MRKLASSSLIATLVALVPQKVLAHCPLCTAGAGAAAAGAAMLGVKYEAIGLLIGAFAAALGFYLANKVKKTYLPGQKWLIVMSTYLLTILPLLPLLDSVFPLVIYWFGDFGTLFNRVYLINRFLFGSILGGILMSLIPQISALISKARQGKRLPYQSLIVTFITLVVSAVILQLVA